MSLNAEGEMMYQQPTEARVAPGHQPTPGVQEPIVCDFPTGGEDPSRRVHSMLPDSPLANLVLIRPDALSNAAKAILSEQSE